jgi:DNA-binding winged helix-turn-helix (wHTH) protein
VGGPAVVRFQGFALDVGRRVVSRAGRRVHLTRKAFDLLTLLVDEAPRVVSKEELHQRLWPDTFVTDATVAGVVKELRRVLGDQESGEPLIRTSHGVGYAFAGTADPSGGEPLADAQYWLISGARRLMLTEGINDIGRDPRVGVWLDSPQASRRHARIIVSNGTATLEDLGSKNRTLLNDHPVTQSTRLSDGDTIQIGPAIFVFRVRDILATTETAAGASPS